MGHLNKYWTIEDDGEMKDLECATKESAVQWAEERFIEACEDEGGWSNGDTREKDVEAVLYYHDAAGEFVEVDRSPEVLFFEYYHGDVKEHGYP